MVRRRSSGMRERNRAATVRCGALDSVPGGMGGREAIQRLREIDPAVKAIVVSGYAQDPVMSEFANTDSTA
jgi:hypothetical protein